MEKTAYLADPESLSFTAYLKQLLDGGPFRHEWVSKRPKLEWSCRSIGDAVQAYIWNGDNFEATESELNAFRHELRDAVQQRDSGAAIDVAKRIQDWGGTRKNKKVVEEYAHGFTSYLALCQQSIGLSDQIPDAFARAGLTFRSNAGFTKIYALLLDNFCIYDSRVAAALCLLVRDYCETASQTDVPSVLSFSLMKERNISARRNPSTSSLKFSYAYSIKAHFQSNMRANWLLQHALANTTFERLYQSDSLRALEAALFMIGYDVRRDEE